MPIMPDKFNIEAGRRLYSIRKLRGLTRAELGKIVGLHESTIKRYEDGMIQSIGIEKVIAFADALETTAAYLLGAVDDPDDESLNAMVFESAFLKDEQKSLSAKQARFELEKAEADLILTARKICGVVDGIAGAELLNVWTPDRIKTITDFISRNADTLRASMPSTNLASIKQLLEALSEIGTMNNDGSVNPDAISLVSDFIKTNTDIR